MPARQTSKSTVDWMPDNCIKPSTRTRLFAAERYARPCDTQVMSRTRTGKQGGERTRRGNVLGRSSGIMAIFGYRMISLESIGAWAVAGIFPACSCLPPSCFTSISVSHTQGREPEWTRVALQAATPHDLMHDPPDTSSTHASNMQPIFLPRTAPQGFVLTECLTSHQFGDTGS